jgi:hypothetical protein
MHGFFAIMSGFIKDDGESEPKVVAYNDENRAGAFEDIARNLDLSAKEIKDWNKSSPLAKTIVVLQNGWFIRCSHKQGAPSNLHSQPFHQIMKPMRSSSGRNRLSDTSYPLRARLKCISRTIRRLPLTLLEIATVAFAA